MVPVEDVYGPAVLTESVVRGRSNDQNVAVDRDIVAEPKIVLGVSWRDVPDLTPISSSSSVTLKYVDRTVVGTR